MEKLLVSPLPWFLLACLIIALAGIARRHDSQRVGHVVLLALTIGMWLLSVPPVSSSLAGSLWIADRANLRDRTRPTIVVVLAGGSFRANDGHEYLAPATTDRVITGVRAFRDSDASRIVMSGRSGTGTPASQVQLMKAMAVALGVPAERIAGDARSRNTLEHPRELFRGGLASPSERILVVTEPTHVRRALTEFKRIFPFAEPFPTPRRPAPPRMGISSWIPQTEVLTESTRSIREWSGIAWYSLQNLLSRRRQIRSTARSHAVRWS